MNTLQHWLQAPQTHWLRRLLFQIHLWAAVSLGLYVLVIALSGSALLLKGPFYGWFEPKWVEPTGAAPLTGEALNARMAEVYEGYALGFTVPGYEPENATYVVLNRDGEYFPHYFNQYTGEDLGPANPWPIKAVEWVANVHDDLLLGRGGRKVNGALALLFVLMALSGLVIWWQGRRAYEGLIINPRSRRPLLWQLHSCVGFWTLLLLLAWGISGFQLGFPGVVNGFVDWLDRNPGDLQRPDALLRFFRGIHFARYGEGAWARWAWIVLSFIPSLLLLSGLWLWIKRLVRRRGGAARPRPPG